MISFTVLEKFTHSQKNCIVVFHYGVSFFKQMTGPLAKKGFSSRYF